MKQNGLKDQRGDGRFPFSANPPASVHSALDAVRGGLASTHGSQLINPHDWIDGSLSEDPIYAEKSASEPSVKGQG